MSVIIRVPRRQHTVSKVILRRFTWNREMTVYDRQASERAGRAALSTKGPGGAFYVENFISGPHALAAEERWGAIERALADVLPLVDRRTALDDSDAVEILRDVLALHWARSISMKIKSDEIARELTAQSRARILNQQTQLLASAYRHRMGLEPVHRSELEWFNDDAHRRVAPLFDQVFADRLSQHFVWARNHFGKSSVQLGYAADGDFLIGDAPVITQKSGHPGTGPHQGVALLESNNIVMPLGPAVVLGLGGAPEIGVFDRSMVNGLNQLQWRSYNRWIACRPNGASSREWNSQARRMTGMAPR